MGQEKGLKLRFCEENNGSKDRWFTARCQGGVDDISEEVEQQQCHERGREQWVQEGRS